MCYLSVWHCEYFLCVALCKSRPTAHLQHKLSFQFQSMVFLADSGPFELCYSALLFYLVSHSLTPPQPAFPFGEKTTTKYSKHEIHIHIGSLALYPLIYCTRTANLNRNYFYCWFPPEVFTSPLPILLSLLALTAPFLIPTHYLTKKAIV